MEGWPTYQDGMTKSCERSARTAIVTAKGYGRDLLCRDRESHYVFLRYWKSEEARQAALEDPAMQRCWARLGNEIQIVKVYETLTEVPLAGAK